MLPEIISTSQSGCVKGKYIVENNRLINDFEIEFDSVEWDFLQTCLQSLNFGRQLRRWVSIFYNDITSCVLNNGYASNHFVLK